MKNAGRAVKYHWETLKNLRPNNGPSKPVRQAHLIGITTDLEVQKARIAVLRQLKVGEDVRGCSEGGG